MTMITSVLLLALYSMFAAFAAAQTDNGTACEICGKPLPDEEAFFDVDTCTTVGGCGVVRFYCLELERESNQLGADSCADYQANYTYDCCGVTRAPVTSLAPVTFAPFTYAPSLAPGNCSLCEDFSEPPLNCSYTESETVAIAREDTCPAVQAVFGFYCGCDNPSAESACRICGGPLPDPEKTYEESGCNEAGCFAFAATCIELEYQANLIGLVDQCNETQAMYAEQCCGGKERTEMNVTVAPVMPSSGMDTTTPMTTAPISETSLTMAPVTAAPVMIEMNMNTTAPVTIAPVTIAPVTTAPVTTAPVMEMNVTTTAPVTSAPVTTAPVMDMNITNITNGNVTGAPVTPGPVALAPVPLTSGAPMNEILVAVMVTVIVAVIRF